MSEALKLIAAEQDPEIRRKLYAAWRKVQVDKAIRWCQACPLSRSRTRAVPGYGPVPARVALVGEAPGAEEDLAGRPFVGPAGRKLDELLELAGLRRDQVFIMNAVCCRPFRNRQPEPEELQACDAHFRAQLEVADPKVIVTLGATALGKFRPGAKLGTIHAKPFATSDGRWVFPLYHPAAALHNTQYEQPLRRGFEALGQFLRSLEAEDQPFEPPDEVPAGPIYQRIRDLGWALVRSRVLDGELVVWVRDETVALPAAYRDLPRFTLEELADLVRAGDRGYLRLLYEAKKAFGPDARILRADPPRAGTSGPPAEP